MSKVELAAWLLGLPDGDPRLDAVDSIRRGEGRVDDDSTAMGVMTVSEAARRARVSRPTVYEALRRGALTAAPLYSGGRRWIPEAALRRWLIGCEGRAVKGGS